MFEKPKSLPANVTELIQIPDVADQPDTLTAELTKLPQPRSAPPTLFYQNQISEFQRRELSLQTDLKRLHGEIAGYLEKIVTLSSDLSKLKERASWRKSLECVFAILVVICTVVFKYTTEPIAIWVAFSLLMITGILQAIFSYFK